MSVPPSHLHADKVPEVLEFLRRERDAVALNRRERIAARWLVILGLRVIPLMFLFLVLLIVAALFSLDRTLLNPDHLLMAAFLVVIGLAVAAGACLVLMALTVTVLLKAARQWWLIRRLGLSEQFHAVEIGRARERRLGKRLTLAFAIVTSTLCLVLVVKWARGDRPAWEHVGFGFGCAVLLAPGFAWLAQRCQHRLDELSDLEQLSALLSGSRPSSGPPDDRPLVLPDGALARIVEIERTQICRDRVEALQEARATASPVYAVRKSADVQRTLRSLDLATRLQVEDHIQDLTMAPAAPTGRLAVPDTPLWLAYDVDSTARQITITSIENMSGRPGEPSPRESSRG